MKKIFKRIYDRTDFLLIITIALCSCVYYIKGPECNCTPHFIKEQVRELCGRSNVIPNPTKYIGTLKSKPIFREIAKKEYEYETGFPLTGPYYKIKPRF